MARSRLMFSIGATALILCPAASTAQSAPPPSGDPGVGPPPMPAMTETHYNSALDVADGALVVPPGGSLVVAP